MKKILILFLVLLSFSLISCANDGKDENQEQVEQKTEEQEDKKDDQKQDDKKDDEPIDYIDFILPESSKQFDKSFALTLLDIASIGDKSLSERIVKSYGFEIVMQKNYEKSMLDSSHTVAYTIGKQTIKYKNENRVVFIVDCRYTVGNEWTSNLNVCSSLTDNVTYLENFMGCANDVYSNLKPLLDKENKPIIVTTGFSRGAATSNDLGVLLNKDYDEGNVFCYSFATPCTTNVDENYQNIYNIINQNDYVTWLPFAAMGYHRAGTDIIVNDNITNLSVITAFNKFSNDVAPTFTAMYTNKHSLTKAGYDINGLTPYQLVIYLMNRLTQMTSFDNLSFLDDIKPESDYYPLVQIIQQVLLDAEDLESSIIVNHTQQCYKAYLELYN